MLEQSGWNQKANIPAKMKVHFKSTWPCNPFFFRARPLPNPLMMSASSWQKFFCSWSDWSWQVNQSACVCLRACLFRCVLGCESSTGGSERLRKSKGESDLVCVWRYTMCLRMSLFPLTCWRVPDGRCWGLWGVGIQLWHLPRGGLWNSRTTVTPADKLRRNSTAQTGWDYIVRTGDWQQKYLVWFS